MPHRIAHLITWILAGIVFACLFAFLFAFIVQWLWNMVMPDLFGLKEIGYWQAFGLLILTKILFGSTCWNKDRHRRIEAKLHSRSAGETDEEGRAEMRVHWKGRGGEEPATPSGD